MDRTSENHKISMLYRQLGKLAYEGSTKRTDLSKERQQVNEEGLFIYKFYKQCMTGNNPSSSHCIKCSCKLT